MAVVRDVIPHIRDAAVQEFQHKAGMKRKELKEVRRLLTLTVN